MQIKKIVIENYKSFQFPTSISFPDTSPGKNIFLIGGMNGAGKTSLMEAINICLYGTRLERIFKAINKSELERGNGNVSFELFLITDEKEEIIVKRSWVSPKKNNFSARDLDEKLVVQKEGAKITVQNQQLWQDYIDTNIPKGITQFFFFDGEKIQEIASDEHSEVKLKSSLEAVLGLQYIRQLSDDVNHIKTDERRNFIEISDEDINLRETELKFIRTKINKYQILKKEIINEIQSLKDEYEEQKKRFNSLFGIEPEDSKEIRLKQKKRIQLKAHLQKLDYDVRNLIEKYLPYALAGNLFKDIKHQLDIESNFSKKKLLSNSAENISRDIIEELMSPPPTFTSKLDNSDFYEMRNRIIRILTKEDKSKEQTKLLNISEKDANKVRFKIEEIENSDLGILKTLLEEKKNIEDELESIDADNISHFSGDSSSELYYELQASIESYLTQIGRKKEELRNIEDEIYKSESLIEEKEQEISKLYSRHDLSLEKKEFISECDKIILLLKKYIEKLRTKKIQNLQDNTLDMYKRLSSKGDLISEINVEKKTYEITIKDRNNRVVKKSGLSAGEKEIFAISLLWGLAKSSQLMLPIIIDTPLSRLDSHHRDNIINYYFPSAGEQVIILSTDTEVDKDYYFRLEPFLCGAALLRFDKNRELSQYEEGYFWKS